jgi:spore coat polysaccharide biosynthesis protein SpsF
MQKRKMVATIEARMTSSRLPGKVMMEAGGIPMLGHLFNRLRQVPSVDEMVLATTGNRTDDVLADYAKAQGIRCFRGSEEDVMARVIGAAELASADVLVEITADCPVIDPLIIEQTIQLYLLNPCDYASNCCLRSYPIGMDTQVFSLEVLRRSAALTDDPLDHEHVNRFIQLHPEMFRQVYLPAPPDLYWPKLRLTLDESADYHLIKNIIEYFGPQNPYFNCHEIVNLLRHLKPEWLELNQHVRQKGVDE